MSGRGDTRRTAALFRRYGAGQRRSFVAAFLLLAAEAVTAVALPALIGALINFLKEGTHWSVLGFEPSTDATIPVLAAAIVAVTAVNSVSDSMAEISLAKAGRMLGYNLRVSLFGHLQRLSLAFHLRRGTGDVLSRITSDVQALEDFVVDSVSDILGSVMLLAGTLAFLFWQSWRIALLAAVIIPVLAVLSNWFARRIKESSKVQRAREGDLADTAAEMLSSISVVQTYGRGAQEERKFAGQSRGAMAAILRTARLEAAFSFTVSMLEALVIAAVVIIGARLVDAKLIDAGLLVAFILLIQGMFKPTRRIIKEWNTLGKIYASVERIGDLLSRKPAVQDAPDAVEAPPLQGEIEFRDVSFAYQPAPEQDTDDTPVRTALDEVSFTVAAGESIALVGHSGAGKSTIAQLIPRLYDPHAGQVLFDGYDIRSFTIASLRAQISMVLQETVLFRGTVADNIAYGREGATREEVVAAAKLASAHDFITAMPNGYDTALGERAATLSGGQRQRLAIARAFIRDTPVLVLDEPTTGLDAESSDLVGQALATLMRGRSTVIVSHDLNLIRDVDRILVISAGRILEEGTPADLLARGGLYADLYVRQFGQAAAELTGGPVAAPAPVPAAAAASGMPRVAAEEPAPAEAGADFHTVLLQAMPEPASPASFRVLTGRAASRRGAAPDGALGPVGAPALSHALPGLGGALDTEAMAPHLRSLLAEGWTLDWCAPAKVTVDPRAGAAVRYRIGVTDRHTARSVECLVGGQVLPAADPAARWLSRTATAAAQARGRPDLVMFERLTTLVPELHLVLHAFPVDPDLPGLVAATDPVLLPGILQPRLSTALDGLSLQGCRSHPVDYTRPGGCTLRYELVWRLLPAGRTVKQVAYGRVLDADRSGRVAATLTALGEHLRAGSGEGTPFLVPRCLGHLPDLGLVLVEALPGTPQLSGLVRAAHSDGGPVAPGDLTAAAAVQSCARVAATLHTSGLHLGPTRTLSGEVAAVWEEVDAVAALAPELAASLHALLDTVAAAGDTLPSELGFAHGDFAPSALLFDGPMCSLVDAGEGCLAEPALDLGRLAADLAMAAAKAGPDTGAGTDPGWQLLEAYLQLRDDLDEEALEARVAAYRSLALARQALRGWRQLKPERLHRALELAAQPWSARLPGRV